MGADVVKKLDIIISGKANMADLEKVRNAVEKLQNRFKELDDKLKKTNASLGQTRRRGREARERLAELEKGTGATSTQINKLTQSIERNTRTLEKSRTRTDRVKKSTRTHRTEVDKLRTSYTKVDKAARSYDNTHGKIRGHTEGLRRAIGALRNQILLFVFAFRGLIDVLTSSVTASNQLESALVGLRAVTDKTGTSFYDAQGFIKEFTESGLISVADTAAGLKNLLASGFGMPEAIDLMRTLGDAAAFNRQGTLEYGAAIVGATQGIKNQNSIMTDNAGITKNLNIMYKEYAATIGKGAMSLSELEKRQAIYQGFLKEGALFQGNMNKLTETYIGKTQQLSQVIFMAKARLGDLIKEGLKPVVTEIKNVVFAISDWVKANELLIRVEIKSFFEVLVSVLKTVWSILSGIKSALNSVGINLRDVIILFGTFKTISFLITKFGAALKVVSTLINLAFGSQALRAIANVTKLQRAITIAGKGFRLAGVGAGFFSRSLMAVKLGLASLLGPIGLVITAIGALVGGILWLRSKSKEDATEYAENQRIFAENLRKQIKARYDETQTLLESLKIRRQSSDLTKEEAERLDALIGMQEKLSRSARIDQGLAEAKQKFLELAEVPSQIKNLITDPEGWGDVFKSSMRDSFKEIEKFTNLTDKQMDLVLDKQEERLLNQQKELDLLQQSNEEYNITRNLLEDKVIHGGSLTIEEQKQLANARQSSAQTSDKLNRQKAYIELTQEELRIQRLIRGARKEVAREEKAAEEARKAALDRLLALIKRLEGEIKMMGLVGVAEDLAKFETKMEILEVQYTKFVKDLGAGNVHVQRLREILNDMATKGPIDIVNDHLQKMQQQIDSLGVDELSDKINKHNTSMEMMRKGVLQATQSFKTAEEFVSALGMSLDELNDRINEFDQEYKKRLIFDKMTKNADEAQSRIEALDRSISDLKTSISNIGGEVFGGFFGISEGDVKREVAYKESIEKRNALDKWYFDRRMELKHIELGEDETMAMREQALFQLKISWEMEHTRITEELSLRRIQASLEEWQSRANFIEQMIGGWQEFGSTIYQITSGVEKSERERIRRQADLYKRGQITLEQYEDRIVRIERASAQERDRIQAQFAAQAIKRIFEGAQQAIQIYAVKAAAAAFAEAGGFPFGLAAAASTFAWYSALGAGLGILGGYVTSAIEGNNLGPEGGFLGTPTEDVFEDRNKRLGGSIRAQEVHLSINPVTYIEAEGDIFIGEGITVETFKGLVNEAFVNRAQDALETGELNIDELVNVKG